MLSPVLRLVALGMIFVVAVPAFIMPASAARDAYPATVKAISGIVAMAGSLYLARAISLTLLRSGGTGTFQAAYLAAAALGGLGVAEAISALRPANIAYALAVYCIISSVSGALWVRFYGSAA